MRVSLYEEKSKTTGRSSMILQQIGHGSRTKRSLGIYFKTNPQTIEEKQDKKEKLLLAAKIANEEDKRLLNGDYMIQEQYRTTEDFIAFAEDFIEQHAVVDKRKYFGVIMKLKSFMGKKRIACFELTELSLQRFAKSLANELKGESAHNYFSKLKQILSAATDEYYFKKNPASKIKVKKNVYITKDVLTTTELKVLYNTPMGNSQVRNAFLLSCLTGLRWVDVKQLKWSHITQNTIKLIQAKTKVTVTIPLNKDAIELLGERNKPDQKVFDLPSHTGALKSIKNWTIGAGIEKHITFHCGRHSYGTALIANGVDVSIASKLLGHTSLVNTQRYVRISESLKNEAVQKLPSIS